MRTSLVALLFLSAAACGDDGVHHLADAPPAPDGSTVDAATSGPVTLTVIQSGQPAVAVDVYFQAANGTLVAKVPTNASGVASAIMEPGGYVTAVNPFVTKRLGDDLRTFVGVKPGDQLKLHMDDLRPPLSVTLTAPNDANAASYEVYSNCSTVQNLAGGGGSGGLPTAQIVLYGCGANIDFLIETFDQVGQPIGFLYHPNAAVTDGGTLDLQAETYTVPVPGATLNWTNVPAGFTALSYGHTLASIRGPLQSRGGTVDVSATTSTTFPRATIPNGIAVTSTDLLPDNGFGQHTVLDWGTTGTTGNVVTHTYDLGTALLPTYTSTPTIAIPTRAVTWGTSPGAAQPDFVLASVSINRDSAQGTAFWDWQITLPYTGSTFTLPLMPTEIAKYNLVAGDGPTINDITTAKVPGGYDAVRAVILSAQGPQELVVGATGRLAFESLTRNLPARTAPTATLRADRPTLRAH